MVLEIYMNGDKQDSYHDVYFLTRDNELLSHSLSMDLYGTNKFIVSLATTIATALEEKVDIIEYKQASEKGLERILTTVGRMMYRKPYLARVKQVEEEVPKKKTKTKKK